MTLKVASELLCTSGKLSHSFNVYVYIHIFVYIYILKIDWGAGSLALDICCL